MLRGFALAIGAVVFFLVCPPSFANEDENLQLKSGLWEGISDFTHHLLVLKDDGNHTLYQVYIATGLRGARVHHFSNKNISCSKSECTLLIENTYDKHSDLRLIITPYLESALNVLQTSIDENGAGILSEMYRLDRNNSASSARALLDRYQARFESAINDPDSGLLGLWVGVATLRGGKHLAVLDVKPNELSDFVVFINGMSITNETQFKYTDITEVAEKVHQVSASHSTFANRITFFELSNDALQGQFYGYYKSQVLGPSSFYLLRVNRKPFTD